MVGNYLDPGQLDPERFLRRHRSYVVDLDAVDRVEPYAKNSRVAILDDESGVPVSPSGHSQVAGAAAIQPPTV